MKAATTTSKASAGAADPAVEAVAQGAIPLHGGSADYDALLQQIGDARVVLIGEASHGTHEFYSQRAFITRCLIEEKGFSAVAWESDWPDALAVSKCVRGVPGSSQGDTIDAFAGGYQRFPHW